MKYIDSILKKGYLTPSLRMIERRKKDRKKVFFGAKFTKLDGKCFHTDTKKRETLLFTSHLRLGKARKTKESNAHVFA
ncbi:MAG: hypothetical protein ACRCVT_10550 [Leadbetterella sp.]